MKVAYEDNHIIAVNKACGEMVQGDKTGDETLLDIVKLYLKKKNTKNREMYFLDCLTVWIAQQADW